MGALASRQSDLSQTIALLPGTLRSADAALGPLEASFGPTRTFARELLPGVRQLGPTITAALPWLSQARTLFSEHDLGGLLTDLTPAVQGTSSTLKSTRSLLGGAYALAGCFNHTIIPTGNEKVSDPPLTTGLRDYQELFQSAVGIASSAQNIDGNGRYLRSSTGGGADRVQTGSLAAARSTAMRCCPRSAPAPRSTPRRRSSPARSCLKQKPAEPERDEDGDGAVRRAIRNHRIDFAAIIVLLVLAVVVTGYVLEHQPAFHLGQSYYQVNADFSEASAVTAGQGQAVTIAGVPIGQVGGGACATGAVVQMDIEKKYAPIYRNSTSCCARGRR